MAIPNLISLIALGGVLAKDTIEFQKIYDKEKKAVKAKNTAAK